MADRRRKAGDSTPRASRTAVPSAPGRGAAQDAPADLAGHVPPAVVDSADLDPVATSAISGRAAHVRLGRATATVRLGRPRRAPMTASPIAVTMVSRARQGGRGDRPKGGLRGHSAPEEPMGKRLAVRALRPRGHALTSDGTQATVQVRTVRALARVQISVAGSARPDPASGSVAADHRPRHSCPAGNSRSASTETPIRPSKPISTRPVWSSRLPTPRRPQTPSQSTQASPLRLGRHLCSGRPGRITEPALAVIRAQ